jgi:hypothetical protein
LIHQGGAKLWQKKGWSHATLSKIVGMAVGNL